MEELEAAGICEVGCVGVWRKGKVGVSSIDGRGIRGEVPETAVMGVAYESNSIQE